MFETPILFLLFNRPLHTKKVFESIRRARPRRLFIAADGPRPDHFSDVEKCLEVKQIVTLGIDWECEVKTLFRTENLGCDKAPAEAITWFFDQVEYGIILEDDCLPAISFFSFCETLLKRYAKEERVMMISGFNPLGKWHDDVIDYFYTEGSIWGWASWRRAWNKFELKMNHYNEINNKGYVNLLIENDYPGFTRQYERILKGELDAWDYQWHYARKSNNGLSITPSINLIQNIGFGLEATHTTWDKNPYNGIELYERENGVRCNDIFIPDMLYKKQLREFENSSVKESPLSKLLNFLKR